MAVKTDKFHPDLVEILLDGKKTAEDIFGENGVLKQLTKALLERMLTTELTSWCFWRQPIHEAKEVIVSSDKSSVPQLR